MSKLKDRSVVWQRDKIGKEYIGGKSAVQLAKEYGTYIQNIYRILDKAGVPRRTASEAQKLALKVGRSEHPTEGSKAPQSVRDKISDSVAKAWSKLTDEELEARKEVKREQFAAIPEEQKEEMRKRAADAVLKTSREGSKLEHFLFAELTSRGYNIVFHKKGFIINSLLEIDILMPSLKVAVEVDGVHHYTDIYNNGALAKVNLRDSEKNGLLLAHGYAVIRLKNVAKTCSPAFMRERLKTLLNKLEEIKSSFPAEGKRLIYL